MRLTLKRIAARPTYTIGKLYVDGAYLCDTLELPLAPAGKKAGRGYAIAPGVYDVIASVSPKFKRVLPRLLNVIGRDGILIHRGNTAADTSGCILVGENTTPGRVNNSTPYEYKITDAVREAQRRGYDITITITNPNG